MIITPEATHHKPQEMIAFYKKHFDVVHVITCKKCKNSIALELSGPLGNDLLGLTPNKAGIIVLPVDEKLLSHRIRLDGMIGYQCICGNDTRSFDIEEELSPQGEFHPHEVAAIQEKMSTTGWTAPIKIVKGREHRGSFTAERI